MALEKKALRIGVLIDAWDAEAWAAHVLERVAALDCAEIRLAVRPAGSPVSDSGSSKRSGLLYHGYRRLDAWIATTTAFEPVSLRSALHDVPTMAVAMTDSAEGGSFSEEALREILSYDLDVMIHLGSIPVRGNALTCAKHGIWSYHHSDDPVRSDAASGFWEVFSGAPVVGTLVQVEGGGPVLARSYSTTNRFSVQNCRNKYYWKSTAMLPRAIRQLSEQGPDEFFRRVAAEQPALTDSESPGYGVPGNLAFLRLLVGYLCRVAQHLGARCVYGETWSIRFVLGRGFTTSLESFTEIAPPDDRFYADPHVVCRDGVYYIFIEECINATGKGHISVIALDEHGVWSEPAKVLERPYHLAYPLIFDWEGETYMVPDSSANGTVDVYRCEAFPHTWRFHSTLMDAPAADSTLFEHNGRWWLFAAVKDHPAASFWDDLHLFFADSPLSSDWTPHPLNPVVSDPRRARPAGPVLKHDGELYRFGQNCTYSYGRAMQMHRITALSETDYREDVVEVLEPGWCREVTGLHTLAHVNDLTVIDARIRKRRFL